MLMAELHVGQEFSANDSRISALKGALGRNMK